MISEYDCTFNNATKTVEKLNKLLNKDLTKEQRKKGKMPYFIEKLNLLTNINILISNTWEEISNEER